jgi:hypothetical protein
MRKKIGRRPARRASMRQNKNSGARRPGPPWRSPGRWSPKITERRGSPAATSKSGKPRGSRAAGRGWWGERTTSRPGSGLPLGGTTTPGSEAVAHRPAEPTSGRALPQDSLASRRSCQGVRRRLWAQREITLRPRPRGFHTGDPRGARRAATRAGPGGRWPAAPAHPAHVTASLTRQRGNASPARALATFEDVVQRGRCPSASRGPHTLDGIGRHCRPPTFKGVACWALPLSLPVAARPPARSGPGRASPCC